MHSVMPLLRGGRCGLRGLPSPSTARRRPTTRALPLPCVVGWLGVSAALGSTGSRPGWRTVLASSTHVVKSHDARPSLRRSPDHTTLTARRHARRSLAVPGLASARPIPLDAPGDILASVHILASGGRTDQQFWGEATWLNPMTG